MYVETVLPEVRRQAGDFEVSELAKVGASCQGIMRTRFACDYADWKHLSGPRDVNICTVEIPMAITVVSPTRVEGWSIAYQQGARFDCKKCQWSGKRTKAPFVLIPD